MPSSSSFSSFSPSSPATPIFDYEVYKERGVINNRYQKIEDISKGSYGYVSLATDLRTSNLVAIKYIFPLEEDDEDGDEDDQDNNNERRSKIDSKVRSRLSENICFEALHEVDILNKISKYDEYNIIKLIDFFDSYIVMEYCMGGDLYENIKSNIVPRSTKMITHIGLQIINSIEYVHSLGIYHRDLKPENILISNVKNWTIKLTDWGLATTDAKSFDRDIGSERYMAPELFEKNLSRDDQKVPYQCDKIDLWAIGIVLLNTVFHKNPFNVANQTDKAFCYFAANREALFDVFPILTPDFFQVLLFSLTIDPQHRDLNRLKLELSKIKQYTFDDDIYNEKEYEMFKHVKVPGFDENGETPLLSSSTSSSLNTVRGTMSDSGMLTPASTKKDHNVIHYETQPLSIDKKLNIDREKRKPLAIPTPNSHINKYFDDYKSKKQQNTFNTKDFFTPPSVKNKYIEGIFSSKKNKVWTPSFNTADKFNNRRYSFGNSNGNAPYQEDGHSPVLNGMTYHEYQHLKQQNENIQRPVSQQAQNDEEILFTLEEDDLDDLNDDFTQFQIDNSNSSSSQNIHTEKSFPELLKSPVNEHMVTPSISLTNTYGTTMATPIAKERKNSFNDMSYGSLNNNRGPRSSFSDSSLKNTTHFKRQNGFSFNSKKPMSSSSIQMNNQSQSLTNPTTLSFKDGGYSTGDYHNYNKRPSFGNSNGSNINKEHNQGGIFFKKFNNPSASTVEHTDVFAKRRQSSTAAGRHNAESLRGAYQQHKDHDVLVFSDDDNEESSDLHQFSMNTGRRRSSARNSNRSNTHSSRNPRKNSIQDDLVGSLEQYKNNWLILQQQHQD